jgi:hypothetical protein
LQQGKSPSGIRLNEQSALQADYALAALPQAGPALHGAWAVTVPNCSQKKTQDTEAPRGERSMQKIGAIIGEFCGSAGRAQVRANSSRKR